jgi:formylglycine-generating enzyme required for sulfatase activity
VWGWTRSGFDKETKVVRGASFVSVAIYLRAASRFRYAPDLRIDNIGFRCVRE